MSQLEYLLDVERRAVDDERAAWKSLDRARQNWERALAEKHKAVKARRDFESAGESW